MATILESAAFLSVGSHTLYNGDCVIAASEQAPVSVGSYCAVGRNLTIMPINHDTNYAAVQGTLYRRMFGEDHPGAVGVPSRARSKGGVSIGSDVWIADNVTILGGVTIGDGACIGAGSIVTKSIPPYHIAAGSPAKIIRARFASDVIECLCGLRWWDWSQEKISKNRQFFFLDLSATSPSMILSVINCDS